MEFVQLFLNVCEFRKDSLYPKIRTLAIQCYILCAKTFENSFKKCKKVLIFEFIRIFKDIKKMKIFLRWVRSSSEDFFFFRVGFRRKPFIAKAFGYDGMAPSELRTVRLTCQLNTLETFLPFGK